MFAPLVLPFYASILLSFGLFAGMAEIHRRTSNGSPVLPFVVTTIMYIPVFLLSALAVDYFRFGVFSYEYASNISDPYVEVPTDSKNVVVNKYSSGHEAKFEVSLGNLEQWMVDVAERRRTHNPKATPFKEFSEGQEFWGPRFERLGWDCPNDVVFYQGWRSGRGGGFDVWYSPGSQTGFISASYW